MHKLCLSVRSADSHRIACRANDAINLASAHTLCVVSCLASWRALDSGLGGCFLRWDQLWTPGCMLRAGRWPVAWLVSSTAIIRHARQLPLNSRRPLANSAYLCLASQSSLQLLLGATISHLHLNLHSPLSPPPLTLRIHGSASILAPSIHPSIQSHNLNL
jgi:hypothetical protein